MVRSSLPLRRIALYLCMCLVIVPAVAMAAYVPQQLDVNIGTSRNFWQILGGIITFLSEAIIAFAVAMFSVGALMLTAAGAREELKEKGKNFMIGGVLSVVVVLGAYSIFRIVNCFLTPGCDLLG